MSPLVRGVASPAGVLNHPDAVFCRASGIRLGANRTRHFVAGERPPVGVLIFDDGASVSVVSTVVIGVSPVADIAVAATSGGVSRIHFGIEVHGWQLQVCDLRSTNGTFVCGEVGQWERVSPDRPMPVDDGDRVVFGDRWLRIRTLA